MQVLATVITPDHPLQAVLLDLPEVFLYGSLAPDIVQGRRLQSRLRRHSHNWDTGFALLRSASGDQQAFAMGYLAHLGADVVAHNFFLPACLIGNFDSRFGGHIYTEACFDSIQEAAHLDLLLKVMSSTSARWIRCSIRRSILRCCPFAPIADLRGRDKRIRSGIA